MVLNPFFLQGSQGEQSLVQDLINEQLKMYGVEVYYLPRQYVTKNKIIREVVTSEFNNSYPIEAYVDTFDGYGENSVLLSKFGVQATNEIKLIISQERYSSYITPLIKNLPNIELATRPKEGDLIWFPLGDRLFEIKFVEHEKPFYQLQKNYVYELTCELFRYENELIDTNIEEIDDNIQDQGYNITLTMVGSAVTSTAIAGIVNGGIRFLTLTDRGEKYTFAPRVAISSAPSGGLTASGISTMISGLAACDGTQLGDKIQGVQIRNSGRGYTVAPGVAFVGGKGVGAAATTIIADGVVGVATISSGGGGYINAPSVTFSTPKHVGAAATAVLATPMVGGGVSIRSAPISIGASAFLFPGGTTGGVFYKTQPTVTFENPAGSGTQATATASINEFALYGGNVTEISIGNSGRFYSSVPTVTITAPTTVRAAATVGLVGTATSAYDSGSALNNSSVAISTGGRAYSSQPTVTVGLGTGTVSPSTTAVGIATINSIGVVTGLTFDPTEVWAVGQGATIGAGYTVTPTLSFSSPSPVTATATATISIGGSVTAISIGNSGFGYNAIPTVSITAPSGISSEFRATGIATMRFDSVKAVGTMSTESNQITGISTVGIIVGDRVRLTFHHDDHIVANNFISSSTYVSSIGVSTIFLSENSTSVGIATTSFEFGIDQCGIVTGINITYGGGGYLTPPSVTITNEVSEKNYVDLIAGVHTARGISAITSGIVTEIRLIDGGAKYVLAPTITLGSPTGIGTGSYEYNELVTGSESGTTAHVNSWDATTNTLELKIISGSFNVGETLVGSASGASRAVFTINTDDVIDPYTDNDNIEVEADGILDFSESNPFGNP